MKQANKIPKISVIIPVYNSEKYLKKCLDSLINQTFEDIEIICINDGSTDNSLKILKEYSMNDTRIIVLTQENSKQGAARNRGLEIAKGEFVTFVDSDDWVDDDYCELLYNAATKYNVNIAAASTTRDYLFKVKNHCKLNEEKVIYGANNIVRELKNNLQTCGRLYRFSAIQNLRFEENVLYEDAPYSLRAICLGNSMVTVPVAHYHYFSNPTSTIKQKLDIKRENDKISTNLDLIKVAKENNVDIGDILIYKEDHILWAIKHYQTHKDFYLFGIKIFSKHIPFDNKKTFILYNTACLGDVLLCNSLCQNIKNIFPESKVVFVVDKNWEDAAKYQKDVDEVVIYDKKGVNKGLFGMLRFIKEFKYKKAYASIITYKNERNYTISKLLKCRFVLMDNNKDKTTSVQKRHSLILSAITNKKIQNYPIDYLAPEYAKNSIKKYISTLSDYIVLCTTGKREEKDMPLSTTVGLINKFNQSNQTVVITGAGEKSIQYAEALKSAGCNFIDLTNKTTIPELASVLKGAKCLISIDTGTLHLGYAVGTPTIAVFYEQEYVPLWAPNPDLYKCITIDSAQTPENIYRAYEKLANNISFNKNEEVAYV